jgi:hypothetical protein
MADPISAGVVGSAILPELGASLAAPTITSALTTGLATGGGYGAAGESLFGFEPTIGGFGQGIMEGVKGINTFANQNPITAQLGMKAASSLLPQDKPVHYAPSGQVSRGQIQPMDYMSLLNPQQSTVIRPQSISLL